MAVWADSGRWRVPCCAWLIAFAIASTPACSDEGQQSRADLNTVLFASLDGMRPGYANAGFKRTLEGSLDQSGPVTLLSAGYGRERVTGRADFRHKVAASALLGYQWLLPSVTMSGFIGPEFDYERENTSAGRVSRPLAGIRVQGEVWAHPTAATLFTTTVIAGTARGHLWSRASAGYAVWQGIFVGPEISHYRTDDFREWRLGAHATGFTLGRLTLRLSGGVARFEERTGGYVGLTGHMRM